MKGSKDLLGQIEDGAHDPQSDLPTLLRQCIRLGSDTGSEQLREWAVRELKGYVGETLPSYRLLAAPLRFDGVLGSNHVMGMSVPITLIPEFAQSQLGNEVAFRDPIAAVVNMVSSAATDDAVVKISPAGAPEIVALMNDKLAKAEAAHYPAPSSLPPSQQIERIYWAVSLPPIIGIVDRVRTNLVELVAEMRAGTPAGQTLPSPEVAAQAVDIAINGYRTRIKNLTVNHVVAGGDAAASARGAASVGAVTEPKSRRVWWWIVGGATIVGAVAAVLVLFV
jgi:hypothetical protein